MNLKAAKFGDRVLVHVNAYGNVTSLPSNSTHTMPATVVGFFGYGRVDQVLLGWSANDTLRPSNSEPNDIDGPIGYAPKLVPTPCSNYSYISNIKDYLFVYWVIADWDVIKEYLTSTSTTSNVEWQCVLKGCQKKNFATEKTCWNCGRDKNGKEIK